MTWEIRHTVVFLGVTLIVLHQNKIAARRLFSKCLCFVVAAFWFEIGSFKGKKSPRTSNRSTTKTNMNGRTMCWMQSDSSKYSSRRSKPIHLARPDTKWTPTTTKMLCAKHLHFTALQLSNMGRFRFSSKGNGLAVGRMIMVPESIIKFYCTQHSQSDKKHSFPFATDTHGWPNPTSQRISMENISIIGRSQIGPGSRQRRLVHLPCIFGTAWRSWNQQIDGFAIRFDTKLPFLCEFDSHKYKLCVIDNNTCDSSRKAALRTSCWRHEVTMVAFNYIYKWLRL